MEFERGLSRRQLLGIAATAVAASIAQTLAACAGGANVVPTPGASTGPVGLPPVASATPTGNWTAVGPVSTLDAMPRPFHPAGGPTLYAYVENGTPVALSDQCTHRGCAVAWQDADNKFVCPCHGGTYDRTGTVLGGPPPRPLPRLQTKVEAGTLYVQP